LRDLRGRAAQLVQRGRGRRAEREAFREKPPGISLAETKLVNKVGPGLERRFDPEAMEGGRRVCIDVLDRMLFPERPLVIHVGEGLTTAMFALGEQPTAFWHVGHESLMATVTQAAASQVSGPDAARLVRAVAHQAVECARLGALQKSRCRLVGASGIVRTVVTLAAEGRSIATSEEIRGATNTLAETWAEGRIGGFASGWVRAILIGAAILEGVIDVVGTGEITAITEAKPARMPHDQPNVTRSSR
jgi:hypothetical protein